MEEGQGQGGGGVGGVSIQRSRPGGRRGCLSWLVELAGIRRPQEVHQAHGPALLLEPSLKPGIAISLNKLDLIHSLAGNSEDSDPREGG